MRFPRLSPVSGVFSLLLLVLCVSPSRALDPAPAAAAAAGKKSAPVAAGGDAAVQASIPEAVLPRSFRGIELGMGLDELKAALLADEIFAFRGDRDVSLLPLSEQTLIETAGLSFVRRAFFQLYEGSLYIMSYNFDPSRVDHYSVFTTLCEKYGEPDTLDPLRAVWISGDTKVVLERPLTLKYLDLAVFNKLVEESKAKEGKDTVLRKEFLNGL